jgi:hypothetical protein
VAGEFVIGLLRGGLLGRALSWAVLGVGIGLGQGLADRSRERLVYGLIGGGLGGFLGGFLFEWLRVALADRLDLSQAVGIVILGAGLGLCLALVEQALRRAWVQVQSGRQEGRIYLLAHPRCRLGLDERAEIGIFGDPAVARRHAEIEATSNGYVLHHLAAQSSTRVNGSPAADVQSLKDARSYAARVPAALREFFLGAHRRFLLSRASRVTKARCSGVARPRLKTRINRRRSSANSASASSHKPGNVSDR